MLKSYLISQPYTKFILIEDTLQNRGAQIYDFLLQNHIDKQNRVQYFVFQEVFARVKDKLVNNNVNLHNYVGKLGWNDADYNELINDLKNGGVIFIDSLAHLMYKIGMGETYSLLNSLKNESCVQQIVTLLHQDLLDDNAHTDKLFGHLCTLNVRVGPKFNPDYNRLDYIYKKIGGKIIRDIEEYRFDNNELIVRKIEKMDAKKLLSHPDINPESLSTFKIGLSEDDKRVRDERRGDILPYLPSESNEESGKIIYEFDQLDDWDEEDPDDDLEI